MARSWHYPPWRRIVMQITLCVILAATLGLAMFVSHRKMAVTLTSIRWAGNLGARLPSGWMLEAENQPPILFLIREQGLGRAGRVMTICSEPVSPGVSAIQYLKNSSLLHETVEVLGAERPIPITIAGFPGVLVERKREVEVEDGMPAMYQSAWIAASVTPSGQAISIELVCPQEVDAEADKTIITNTAAGITINGNAPTTR